MVRPAIAAALALCLAGNLAHAQFSAPIPSDWPKSGDWMEFAPGTNEQTYIDGAYSWYGHVYAPDERPGAQPNKGFDIENNKVAKWMSGLKRPDYPPNSCCGKGDAYEVEILKDGGAHGEWIAEITHGELRRYPDNTIRPPLPNGTRFHVLPQHVTKPSQSNPTDTAWIFVSVGMRSVTVYCLVPLPPSF